VFAASLPTRLARLRERADEDLMDLVSKGEARAFEVVFDRHGGLALSLAYRMCGRRAMAEDIVQEAFLSIWRTGARYDRNRGSVRSWILRTVHNRAVDALRRGVVRESRNVSDHQAAERIVAPERTEEEVGRREEVHRVRDALGELPTEQRRVIELAYFGGFTHTEIAEMLDQPIGTVKGRMRLGLTKLRLLLSDVAEVRV
jgi:RNA polymerase sigma-70 factor (ECF subfamily)